MDNLIIIIATLIIGIILIALFIKRKRSRDFQHGNVSKIEQADGNEETSTENEISDPVELHIKCSYSSTWPRKEDLQKIQPIFSEYIRNPNPDIEKELFSKIYDKDAEVATSHIAFFLDRWIYNDYPEIWVTVFLSPFLHEACIEPRMYALNEFHRIIKVANSQRYGSDEDIAQLNKCTLKVKKYLDAHAEVLQEILTAFEEASRPDLVDFPGFDCLSGHGYANNAVKVLRHIGYADNIPKPLQKEYVWCSHCGVAFKRSRISHLEYVNCKNCDFDVGSNDYW